MAGYIEHFCKKVVLLVIDGPISSGKTTICGAVAERSPELVKTYVEQGHDENIIDMFLRNPKKHGAEFQLLMHGCCFQRLTLAIKMRSKIKNSRRRRKAKRITHKMVVVDRSLEGNVTFADANHRLGNICADSLAMYKKQRSMFRATVDHKIDLFVYLWVDPQTCLKRNHARNAKADEQGEGTLEAETYDTFYYMEVEKSAFASLLSAVSQDVPKERLLINWHDAYSEMCNFDRIVQGYTDSTSTDGNQPPVRVFLSYDETLLKEKVDHTSKHSYYFDYSALERVEDFFSEKVVRSVMDALSYTTSYDGPRAAYICLPRCVTSTAFSEMFPLTIL